MQEASNTINGYLSKLVSIINSQAGWTRNRKQIRQEAVENVTKTAIKLGIKRISSRLFILPCSWFKVGRNLKTWCDWTFYFKAAKATCSACTAMRFTFSSEKRITNFRFRNLFGPFLKEYFSPRAVIHFNDCAAKFATSQAKNCSLAKPLKFAYLNLFLALNAAKLLIKCSRGGNYNPNGLINGLVDWVRFAFGDNSNHLQKYFKKRQENFSHIH